jgi:hypothetical protein
MDNQPSFAERAKLLRESALHMQTWAEVVLAEAQRMEAAQMRFSLRTEKRGAARPKR